LFQLNVSIISSSIYTVPIANAKDFIKFAFRSKC